MRLPNRQEGCGVKWTVEATHPGTGEELVLQIEAGTREQASAQASDGGFYVRDCYPERRRHYKVLRTLARVWSCYLGLMVIAMLVVGTFVTAQAFGASACAAILAVIGLALAGAMNDALHREPPTDPRRGFDVAAEPKPPAGSSK
jgi:hypothetical protein